MLTDPLSLLLLMRFVVRAVGITTLFFWAQFLAQALFAGVLGQESGDLNLREIFLRVLVIFAFSAVILLQSVLPRVRGEFWLKFYVQLTNGFYINTIANNFAIRFWPSAAPRSTVPTYIPSYESRGEP